MTVVLTLVGVLLDTTRWLWNPITVTLRKRKRETLEEDEELNEEDYQEAKKKDSSPMPEMLALPEDDTGFFQEYLYIIIYKFILNNTCCACA